jgi:type IV secretory pathway VirJ component
VISGCVDSRPALGDSSCIEVLPLTRGDFPVRVYNPAGDPRGTIVFGSGDGGWKIFEDRSSLALSRAGWRVIGWDCRIYADKRCGPYDREILGRDLNIMAHRFSSNGVVLYAGYSTGAEQAVAAAAWSVERGHSPDGLLLIAPGSRGRYGITGADLMGLTPRGYGTFSLAELAPALATTPVIQIHGKMDPLDSISWLTSLRGEHRLVTLAGTGHFFGDADPVFLAALTDGAAKFPAPHRP